MSITITIRSASTHAKSCYVECSKTDCADCTISVEAGSRIVLVSVQINCFLINQQCFELALLVGKKTTHGMVAQNKQRMRLRSRERNRSRNEGDRTWSNRLTPISPPNREKYAVFVQRTSQWKRSLHREIY